MRENGIVRLGNGRLGNTPLANYPMSTWVLTNRGVQIPLDIKDDGDDMMESGDWVQFYGQALDDEPKTVLNHDFPEPFEDLYEAADFTDENVYYISASGAPQPPMTLVPAAPDFTSTPPAAFDATLMLQVDDAFRPTGGADPWYWLPTILDSNPEPFREDTAELVGLNSTTDPIRVRLNVRGSSSDPLENDHVTRLTVRNASDQVLIQEDAAFDDFSLYLYDVPWTHDGGAELSPELTFRLDALDTEAARNHVILDFIEVTYPRSFTALGGPLDFSWPNETQEFEIDGLASTPRVYELRTQPGTGVLAVSRLTGIGTGSKGAGSIRFKIEQDPVLPADAMRRFVVADITGISVPPFADIDPDSPSSLRDPSIQADMIIIAHPDVVDGSPDGPLPALMAWRATPEGGGIDTRLVSLPDVYDAFNDGLAGPTGIKNFLSWVLSDEGWAEPKPQYLMLLGDASYDYKSGSQAGTFVPTQMLFRQDPILGYYASDNLLAAVVGDDQMPDLVVGRLPARTVEQANVMLAKILAYEQDPEEGAWRQNMLLISDRGTNAGEGNLDFEITNDRVMGLICSEGDSVNIAECPGTEPYTTQHLRYFTDYFTNPAYPLAFQAANAARADIKAIVNGFGEVADGAAILQYNGHGNFVVWSSDAFFDERPPLPPETRRDTEFLTNGGKLPWLMAHNCLTGGFHVTDTVPEDGDPTMGENWLRREGGGAVGVFAPTGLSFNYVGQPVSDLIWADLFGPRKERRVAVPVMRTLALLCGQGSYEPCQYYALQGDPAMRLTLPDIAPATDVTVDSGHQQATLQWTASATPGATYDVFRTRSVASNLVSYEKVNAGPIAGTSIVDDAVENAREYFYYVEATSPEGFKSRWSNFNEDCNDGPDCVRAFPLNPDPPSVPTGLSIDDPGTGSQLTVSWNANPETDLDFYTLRWGPSPDALTSSVDVDARSTLAGITELTSGEEVFFAVSATNTSGRTSDLSDASSDFPAFAPGVRAPAFIDDLRLEPVGDDLVVSWSEVDRDVYGKPMTVAVYDVLRGTARTMGNDDLTVIGQCVAPCTEWTDPGAATSPTTFVYRVRARTSGDLLGALGGEYPASTTLSVDKSTTTPGGLVLSWNPVTTTVGGAPTQIRHYLVFASETPFGIEDVLAGTAPLLTTVTGTTLEIAPGEAAGHYSIVAEDTLGNLSRF